MPTRIEQKVSKLAAVRRKEKGSALSKNVNKCYSRNCMDFSKTEWWSYAIKK